MLEADYQLQLILYLNFGRHQGDRSMPRLIPQTRPL